jgi:hypothetical protein
LLLLVLVLLVLKLLVLQVPPAVHFDPMEAAAAAAAVADSPPCETDCSISTAPPMIIALQWLSVSVAALKFGVTDSFESVTRRLKKASCCCSVPC